MLCLSVENPAKPAPATSTTPPGELEADVYLGHIQPVSVRIQYGYIDLDTYAALLVNAVQPVDLLDNWNIYDFSGIELQLMQLNNF